MSIIEPLSLELPELESEVLNLEDFRIDPDIEIKEPIPILSYYDQGRRVSMFTEDNISMIQGKAKSRKSTFIKAIGAAICSGEYGVLRSNYSRNKIAIFDTEQGAFHCWKAVRMIKHLSGVKIDYYKISGLSTQQKKFLVETHLKQTPECGFIILDNIVHFLTDFNSASESTELNLWLIKLKGDYNTHINLVLHENGSEYGSGKAKGHIGTLLENTCETIIRVEKNKDDKSQSIVTAKAMRGLEFDPILIEMDGQGVPFLSTYDEPVMQKQVKF